jgi:hypothetical protein
VPPFPSTVEFKPRVFIILSSDEADSFSQSYRHMATCVVCRADSLAGEIFFSLFLHRSIKSEGDSHFTHFFLFPLSLSSPSLLPQTIHLHIQPHDYEPPTAKMHHVPHILSIVALLSWSVVGNAILPLPTEMFPLHPPKSTTDHIFVNVGLRDGSLRNWRIQEKHAAAYVRILITWADNLILERENDWPPARVCQVEGVQADIPPTDDLNKACKDIMMKGRDILDIDQKTSKIITTTCEMTRMKIIIPDNFLNADKKAFWSAVDFFDNITRELQVTGGLLPTVKSLRKSIKKTGIYLIDAPRNLDVSTFRTIIRAFIASQVYVPTDDFLEEHTTEEKAIARDGFYHWVKHTYPGRLVRLPPKVGS